MNTRLITLTLGAAWLLVPALASAHGNRPLPRSIYLDPSDDAVQVLVSSDQGLHITLDSGTSWYWVCEDILGYDTYTFAMAGAPAPDPRTRTWIVGGVGLTQEDQPLPIDGVYTSTDGGCNWSPASGVLEGHWASVILVHPERPSEVLVATQHNTRVNGVALSEDAGATWSWTGLFDFFNDTDIGQGQWVNGMTRAPTRPDTLYASSVHALHTSTDGGRTWTTWGDALIEQPSDMLQVHKADPADPETVYFSHFKPTGRDLYVSPDGGDSYTLLLEAGTREFSSMAITGGPDREGRSLVVATRLGTVYRSDDDGEVWSEEETFIPIECLENDLNDPQLLYVCSNLWAQPPGPRYALGASSDGLTVIDPQFTYSDIMGHIQCDDDSQVNQICIPLDNPGVNNGAADTGIGGDDVGVGVDTSLDDVDAGRDAADVPGLNDTEEGDVTSRGDEGGCNCATHHRGAPSSGWLWASIGALLVWRRRRVS